MVGAKEEGKSIEMVSEKDQEDKVKLQRVRSRWIDS